MLESFEAGAALIFGATGGIGRAIAMEFGRAGTDVAVTYRTNQSVADQLLAELRALGRTASAHLVDVTQPDQIEKALVDAVNVHERIHTLVFAAGPLVEQRYLAEISAQGWQRAIEIEATGFFNVFQASVGRLRKWGGGSFVHLGSAGDVSWPKRDGLSVAPKAVNEALIRGIAREEGRFGIRANSVLVGAIDGGMFLKLKERGELDQKWVDETIRTIAIKRLGKPEEIGYAVVFLASNRAAYVTGQQINVSGGYGL